MTAPTIITGRPIGDTKPRAHIKIVERHCLTCSRAFLSAGAWNVVCPRCKTAAARKWEFK